MSPAAASRFARRNMRHASPAPDLVTSLLRPPSPDGFYTAGQTPHSRTPADTPRPPSVNRRNRSHPPAGRGSSASPPQSSGASSLGPHPSSLDIPKKYGGDCIFDMYSLSYVAEPDSALLCPICHDPMVDPVTTPCDHTFCYRCLRRSIASSPSGTACPVDRHALSWSECARAGRLIRTQLNSLVVKCPNRSRGCNQEMRREAAESHATTECRFREYPCPDPACDKKLRQKSKTEECQHVPARCRYCDEAVQEADREWHLSSCPRAKTRCESCWQLVQRSSMSAHHETDCDGIEVACTYHDLGCPVRVERGELADHLAHCPFHPETASGAVIRSQRELLQTYNDLGAQIHECRRRQDETSRRLDEISTGTVQRTGTGTGSTGGAGDAVMSDNRTMQDLDAGFEEVHQNLTHLEARQSMWTLNQVMPIREEVTELRNNINMIRMHVNWLLNRSREEGRVRAAANNAASSGGAIRRDNSTEPSAMARPGERRRSSGTDTDLPRL